MMKLQNWFMVTVMAFGLLMSGCESETKFGPCVGIGDEKDPTLNYKVSTNNLIVAIIFSETVYVPVLVALTEAYCPVGRKSAPATN